MDLETLRLLRDIHNEMGEQFSSWLDREIKQGQTVPEEAMLRPEVMEFAKAMEVVLKANDHKGGWEDSTYDYLDARLVEEVGEYFGSVASGDKVSKARKELVDIANFCMFLWGKSRG